MYHYLFTNDLRVSNLDKKLCDASGYIQTDSVPSATQDKSLNNNINTLAFYFGLLKDSANVQLCLNGHARNVVLNFIKKFQFPNPRTNESYQLACSDEIRIAPLRFILQVLYVFRMISPDEAYMNDQEILDFIFYNSEAAKSETPSALSVVTDILSFRETGEYPDSVETDPEKRVWKHEARQVHEITDILEWSGCVTRTSAGQIEIKHNDLSEADKAMLFDILTCNDFWHGDHAQSFDKIKQSYFSYLDSDPIADPDGDKNKVKQPHSDIIDFAVAEFAEHRLDDDWVKLLKRDGYEGIHARYDAMSADELREMDDAEFDKWIEDELWAASIFFCGQNLKKLTHEQKQACADFIAKTKVNFKLSHKYFGKSPEIPDGFGPVAATELLMKFHPLDYIGYSKLMLQGLKTLGLVNNDNPPNTVTVTDYHQMMGYAAMLLERLTEAKVPRMFNETEATPPDYITANEFIWWCKHYRMEILKKYWEKYMKTDIKKVEQKNIEELSEFIKQLETDVTNCGLVYAKGLMRRFVCALLAKPFVVLTGLSGSGKTKLAQAFTDWIAVENTAKVVPVGADWTNSEKLLGYPNALDPEKYVLPDTGVLKLLLDASREENQDVPFFLILDEMNLSHVERYFADFLSTMESEGTIKLYDGQERIADDGTPVPPTLPWPKNLFVIGTMNVDETTYMFSPKVLDRAQVIEFRVEKKNIEDFLSAPKSPKMGELKEKGAAYAKAFLKLLEGRKDKKPEDAELGVVKSVLAGMFEELANLGAEFGFRSAVEIVNFIEYYLEACGYGAIADGDKKSCLTAAIDAAVVQKLLPKLHGSQNRLAPVLDKLMAKSSVSKSGGNPEDEPKTEPVYELTFEKLARMKERVEKNGFTSFAEA